MFLMPSRKSARTPTPAAGSCCFEQLESRLLLDAIPILHSNPGAPLTLYLDFDGGSYYGEKGPYDRDGNPTDYNAQEVSEITHCWQDIVGFYSMFDLDVTTELPDYNHQTTAWLIVSPDMSGGSAVPNSLPNKVPRAANNQNNATGRTTGIAHEFGHIIALGHQSTFDLDGNLIATYRGATNNVGPMMGVDYAGTFPRWWVGHTGNASKIQDDIKQISEKIVAKSMIPYTGDGFHADDYAGNLYLPTADYTLLPGTNHWTVEAVIERMTDADVFAFDWSGGYVTVAATNLYSAAYSKYVSCVGLDLHVFNSSGDLVGFDKVGNDNDTSYSIQMNLPAGRYYATFSSFGDYSDLGTYEVSIDSASGTGLTQPKTSTPELNALIAVDPTSNLYNQVKLRLDNPYPDSKSVIVERSTDGVSWSQIYTSSTYSASRTVTDSSSTSTTYFYRYGIRYADNSWHYATPLEVTTYSQSVSGLTITNWSGLQILDWTDNRRDNGYGILESKDGGAYTQIYATALNYTSYTPTQQAGHTYAYQVIGLAPNAAPLAGADLAEVLGNESYVFNIADLLANDSDPDGEAVQFLDLSDSLFGTVTYDVLGQTVTYVPDYGFVGGDWFDYRVSDGLGHYAIATVNLNVTSSNDQPTLDNPIGDVNVDEDDPDTVLDLSNVFSDTEDPVLALSITGDTTGSYAAASIDNGILTIHYGANAFGTGEIIIRATDSGGRYVEDTFTVTVNSVNDTPVLLNPISDVTVDEDAPETLIDLSGRFSDVEDASLIITIAGNTDGSFFTASIDGGILTLSYNPNGFGTSQVTIRAADSGGLYVDDTFTVSVNAVNDAPLLVRPIGGLTVDAGYPDMVIDLGTVITDAEPGMTYAVIANTNPGLVPAAINGDNLTLSYPASGTGTTQITIRATDTEGLFVEDSFTVRVGPYIDSTGLVARYTFDDSAAGDWAPYGSVDDSGVLTGGASIVSDPQRGLVLRVDGADGLVAVAGGSADIDNFAVTQRTISLFFKADALTGTQIIYEEGGYTAQGGMSIYLLQSSLCVYGYGNRLMLGAALLPDDHQWHHVALVMDTAANRMYGYLDGVRFTMKFGVTTAAHGDGTGIGGINSHSSVFSGVDLDAPSDTFAGLIDDVRIYNRPLAAEEVAALAGKPSVAAPIDDVAVNWVAPPTVIDLSGVFSNPTGEPLTFSVTGNTAPGVVAADIDGYNLSLDYAAFVGGFATITVRATTDAGQYVEDTFNVDVQAVVDPTAPVVVSVDPAGVTAGAILPPTKTFTLVFSDPIYSSDAEDAGNYRLVSPGPDATLGTADDVEIALIPTADGSQVTLSAGAVLAPSRYRLTVYDELRNHAGLSLDGDGDGSPGGDWSAEFAVAALGDVDRDGDIDNADIGKAAGSFTGAGGSTTKTYEDGDMDGDGDVDNADLGLIAGAFTGAMSGRADLAILPAQMGGEIPPPAAPAEAPAVQAAESVLSDLMGQMRPMGPVSPISPISPIGLIGPIPDPADASLSRPAVFDVLGEARLVETVVSMIERR